MSRRRTKSARAQALRVNQEQLEKRILFVAVAETLLVDVNATGLPEGPLTTINNAALPATGGLGGVFEARGGEPMVPVIGKPVSNATSGTVGIRMDGDDFLALVQEAGGALLTAPAGLTGTNPTRSIEAWVWNPGIAGEETIFAWGRRGGPDGSNMSFNYGNHNEWGAVGHWGQPPDAGWGPPAGPQTVPAARFWHHLVYTYDGTTTRLYVDGAPLYTEVLGAGTINTHADTPMLIGAQTEADGVTVTPALRGTLTVGRVRVHDGVLTDAQVLANYNEEKAGFVEPVIPQDPTDPPVKIVDIDPTTLPEGEPLTSIPNTANPLGGFFEARGGGDTVPVVDQPVATATSGTRGIRLDGNDFLQHVTTVGGDLLPAPAGITGAATSSVEVWAWNPGVVDEETMVAWGRRGGPDGTNYSFNYGNNAAYGAMGHWGSPDMGWGLGTGANAPVARQWHHLVYVFDGTTQRVYVDGVQTNSEVLGEGTLNVASGPTMPINIGTQIEPNGETPTPGLRGTLTLGRVRVYDGVLPIETITANYNAERAGYVEPGIPPPPPAVKLVDVDATALPAGSAANNIPNTGTLGGVFNATGGADTTPVAGQPLTSATTGTRGIRLDGNDYLQLVTSPTDATLITAPESLTGVDPKRSIEVWAYNPGIAAEENMVSWGHRGGPNGSNMAFGYGSSGAFGAVGQWGPQDMGWGTVPSAQNWHHLVYTYDGATTRVYVDGVQTNSEILGEGAINTHAGTAINIGTQLEIDGFTPTNLLRGSLTLGKVRIYEGVLTPAQISGNYDAERAAFVNPDSAAPAALTSGPIHRYSFNNAAGAAGDGTVIEDLVGTADATVRGAGATFNGTDLVLPGGPSTSAPYVDLPNNILSALGAANPGGTGQVTFEGWVRHVGNRAWSRFYDFGVSTAGELTGPGGAGTGVDFFMLTAQTGGANIRRFEVTQNSDGDGAGNRWDEVTGGPIPQDLHFAVTWNETTGQVKYYQNGREVGGMPSPILISAMNDINNFLGRSQFTADANLEGEFDEFRIYDHALSAGEVAGNFAAGPDVVNTGGGISQVYVRGSGWNAAFKTYMEAQGLGDDVYGYRVDDKTGDQRVLPWTNVNEIVLRFSVAPTGGGIPTPGTVTLTGDRPGGNYTVTAVNQLDPQTFVLVLDRPLGNLSTGGENGVRVNMSVGGAGSGGSAYNLRLDALQGDVNHAGETTHSVVAADFSDVKNRFFRTTAQPGPAGPQQYTVFHDVDGSGGILANDFSLVKARFFDSLLAAPPSSAALSAGGVTEDLFSNGAVL